MNINIVTIINNITINRETIHAFHLILFFFSCAKSFEIFPKHNGYGFISEFFGLN